MESNITPHGDMEEVGAGHGKNIEKGIFTVSLDLEYAWGTPKERVERKREQFERNRQVIEDLLKLFAKYNISATWGAVGKLFLENGEKNNSIYDAKDVIMKIRDFEIKQEIASHSFEHKSFAGHSEEEAQKDLENCIKAADKLGIELKSFIFPYNHIGHLNILKNKGFLSYREADSNIWKEINFLPWQVKMGLGALSELFALTPPVSKPFWDSSGLLAIAGSAPYLARDSILKFIPIKSKVMRARRGINRAVKENKVFHFWFHPFNIASDSEKLLKGLDEILNYAAKKRDEGALDILNMQEIYNRITE